MSMHLCCCLLYCVCSRLQTDCMGHGSMVASVAGTKHGVAPGVTLGSYRVFGCSGYAADNVLVEAIDRAVRDGCDVINLSLASGSGYEDNVSCCCCCCLYWVWCWCWCWCCGLCWRCMTKKCSWCKAYACDSLSRAGPANMVQYSTLFLLPSTCQHHCHQLVPAA